MMVFKESTMKIATAKKLAAENNFAFEYSNSLRLYVLQDRQEGWPDQYFPGSALRSMQENVFVEFFLRIKPAA
jgi:hypothetical protein